jgi:hypothetical protein
MHVQLAEDGLEVIPRRVHADAEYVGYSGETPVADESENDLPFPTRDAQSIDRRFTGSASEQRFGIFVFKKRP